MNKLQKKLVIFVLVLSLAIFVSMCKALKVVIGEKEKSEALSLKVDDITKKGKDLKGELEGKEEELAKAKLNLEDLNFEVKEEKKKANSFKERYEDEKKNAEDLNLSLNKLKLTMKEEKKKTEELDAGAEKLKEENAVLSQKIKEMKAAQEALEAFVAESEVGEPTEEKAAAVKPKATTTISSGKIVTIYPQGLLGIELETSSHDSSYSGKIVKGERQMMVSNVHSHMIILEVSEGEDMSGFNKDDSIKYIR